MTRLKRVMTEEEMQKYVNGKLGYKVEFLLEYAIRELGYEAKLREENNKEYYLFYKR